jgi:hypothetical protein
LEHKDQLTGTINAQTWIVWKRKDGDRESHGNPLFLAHVHDHDHVHDVWIEIPL